MLVAHCRRLSCVLFLPIFFHLRQKDLFFFPPPFLLSSSSGGSASGCEGPCCFLISDTDSEILLFNLSSLSQQNHSRPFECTRQKQTQLWTESQKFYPKECIYWQKVVHLARQWLTCLVLSFYLLIADSMKPYVGYLLHLSAKKFRLRRWRRIFCITEAKHLSLSQTSLLLLSKFKCGLHPAMIWPLAVWLLMLADRFRPVRHCELYNHKEGLIYYFYSFFKKKNCLSMFGSPSFRFHRVRERFWRSVWEQSHTKATSLKDLMAPGSQVITIIGISSHRKRTLTIPLFAFPVLNSVRLVRFLSDKDTCLGKWWSFAICPTMWMKI